MVSVVARGQKGSRKGWQWLSDDVRALRQEGVGCCSRLIQKDEGYCWLQKEEFAKGAARGKTEDYPECGGQWKQTKSVVALILCYNTK